MNAIIDRHAIADAMVRLLADESSEVAVQAMALFDALALPGDLCREHDGTSEGIAAALVAEARGDIEDATGRI
jgi:uncharacterized protein (DUF2336 family)